MNNRLSPGMPLAEFIALAKERVHMRVTSRIVTSFLTTVCLLTGSKSPTLGDALTYSSEELWGYHNLGPVTLKAWKTMLGAFGLSMGMTAYETSRYFARQDGAACIADGDPARLADDGLPWLTTDICLRYLTSAGYTVTITMDSPAAGTAGDTSAGSGSHTDN